MPQSERDRLQTSYAGIPGERGGLVHVFHGGKPICGARLHPNAQIQFCAWGINIDYVECHRCKQRAEAMVARARRAIGAVKR